MKKLINICGASRSGSTMVDLMIGNDPRAFSLGEVYAWFRPFRSHHFNIICSCGKDNCPWQTLKNLKEKDFHKNCFNILNVNVLVDSSKNIPWVIDSTLRCQKANISVSNILLYKKPIPFFYSYWKRGVPINFARKKILIRYYQRFFETNLSFIAVNFDNLVLNPAGTLEQLCNLIEIPYFKGKERFWEKRHHHLFGSMGTRKQVESGKSIIRKKEEYPDEFTKIIPKIEFDNNKDKEFLEIFSKLEKYELRHKLTDPNSIQKPYWYYLVPIQGYNHLYLNKKAHFVVVISPLL